MQPQPQDYRGLRLPRACMPALSERQEQCRDLVSRTSCKRRATMRCLGRGIIAAEARPQQQLSHPKAARTRNRRKCLFKFQRTCASNRLRAIRDAQQESRRGPNGEADHKTLVTLPSTFLWRSVPTPAYALCYNLDCVLNLLLLYLRTLVKVLFRHIILVGAE